MKRHSEARLWLFAAMKALLVLACIDVALWTALSGCGMPTEVPTWSPPMVQDAAAEVVICGPVVETHLPENVVMLCTACDDACGELGKRCDKYAAACGDDGEGVCVGWCDGELGVLRCMPSEKAKP